MTIRDYLLLGWGGLPVGGQQRRHIILIGHSRLAREDVFEVGKGFFAVALAGNDNRVDDGGALAGVGMTDEEPVSFSDARRPDRVLYSEMAITPSRVRGGWMLSRDRTVSPPQQLGVIPRRPGTAKGDTL